MRAHTPPRRTVVICAELKRPAVAVSTPHARVVRSVLSTPQFRRARHAMIMISSTPPLASPLFVHLHIYMYTLTYDNNVNHRPRGSSRVRTYRVISDFHTNRVRDICRHISRCTRIGPYFKRDLWILINLVSL